MSSEKQDRRNSIVQQVLIAFLVFFAVSAGLFFSQEKFPKDVDANVTLSTQLLLDKLSDLQGDLLAVKVSVNHAQEIAARNKVITDELRAEIKELNEKLLARPTE